jgi:hypothetical protein
MMKTISPSLPSPVMPCLRELALPGCHMGWNLLLCLSACCPHLQQLSLHSLLPPPEAWVVGAAEGMPAGLQLLQLAELEMVSVVIMPSIAAVSATGTLQWGCSLAVMLADLLVHLPWLVTAACAAVAHPPLPHAHTGSRAACGGSRASQSRAADNKG